MQVEHRDPEGSHKTSGNCGFRLRERDSLPPRFIAPCDPHVPAWVVNERGKTWNVAELVAQSCDFNNRHCYLIACLLAEQ